LHHREGVTKHYFISVGIIKICWIIIQAVKPARSHINLFLIITPLENLSVKFAYGSKTISLCCCMNSQNTFSISNTLRLKSYEWIKESALKEKTDIETFVITERNMTQTAPWILVWVCPPLKYFKLIFRLKTTTGKRT
jgi:hypothetical protein